MNYLLRVLYITACGSLLSGCGGSNEQGQLSAGEPTMNILPVANAGYPIDVIIGADFMLDASKSFDSDGHISSYEWLLNSKVISNDMVYQVSPSVAGSYTYQLIVTDNEGATDQDQINVRVTSKVSADINHFLFYGQSLSVGGQGLPVLTTEQPYNNVTFSGGPRADLDEVYAFKPLVEDDDPAPDGFIDRGETPSSSAGNMVTRLIEIENDRPYTQSRYNLLVSTAGHGGWKIDELNKESFWYQQYVLSHIQGGYDVAKTLGKAYEFQAIGWLQGEADIDSAETKDSYIEDLKKLRADIEADAKLIVGQVQNIPLITYQMAWKSKTSSKIPLALLEASEEDPFIYLATPMYHFPYQSDKVHLTNIGYSWLGHYFGRVFKRVVYDSVEWKPTSPKAFIRNGTIIDIEFNVPEPPLVIDKQTLGEISNAGFLILDDSKTSVTINSVQLTGPEQVRIVLDTNPIGALTIRYGLDHSSSIIDQNIADGAGGQLRDSSHNVWSNDGLDYPLWNWCVIFEKEIN